MHDASSAAGAGPVNVQLPCGEQLTKLYWRYEAIVRSPGVTVLGRPIAAPPGAEPDGRDTLFWHLVTENTKDSGRQFSPRRAALMSRVWDLLERLNSPECDARYRLERRAYRHALIVTPADCCFVVVLRLCRRSLLLVTAYPVSAARRQQHHDRTEPWLAQAAADLELRHPLWHDAAPTLSAPLWPWGEPSW